MNQQQASGMDATGSQGQPMFAVGGVQVLPSSYNTGSASVSVTRSDLANLTTGDYTLQYTNGNWQLEDASTGQAVSMAGSGTAADPFQAAGLSIVVGGGAPANGDSYLIQPTAAATSGLQLLLTSPSQIASASLAQSAVGAGNSGSGSISAPTITNPSTWVPATYTIAFSSPSQYQVTNGSGAVVGSGTYTSGSPISFAGAQVTVSGVPATGDTFTVSPNTAGSSDNSNLLAAIAALSAPTLSGGTASLTGAANALVSQVGVLTQQAQANASAQQQVNQDATTALNNISGVNLDEEAANMVQYQQAYQAMAEMIQTSGQMFTSLMSAITDG
jgi:flagellar hook-associated protein 1